MSEYDVFDVACISCGNSTFGVLLKPDTLNRIVCPECKTPGYVYVSNNLDILTFVEDELCKACQGTGKCKTCMGSLKMPCPDCSGKGIQTTGTTYNPYYLGCPRCGGSGHTSTDSNNKNEITKKIEYGSGKVDCSSCSGTGICSACQGNRFVTK